MHFVNNTYLSLHMQSCACGGRSVDACLFVRWNPAHLTDNWNLRITEVHYYSPKNLIKLSWISLLKFFQTHRACPLALCFIVVVADGLRTHGHMVVGNYRCAAACYEKIIQVGPENITHHEVRLFLGVHAMWTISCDILCVVWHFVSRDFCIMWQFVSCDFFSPCDLFWHFVCHVTFFVSDECSQGLLLCMMRQGKFMSARVHVNGLQTRRYV